MKFARILSLILAILLMACAFVACDTKEDPEDPANGTQTPEEVALSVVESGQSKYVIVRDYKASGTVVDAVNSMKKSFEDYLGCEIAVRECFNGINEAEDVEQETEILVGATNREASGLVSADLKTNDYKIDIVGKKIVIIGGSDEATSKAISKFTTALVQSQGNKNDVQMGKKLNLTVFKNLPEESDNKKYDVSIDTFNSFGKYSYGKVTMGGARLDSYVLVAPREGQLAESNLRFAQDLQAYAVRYAGYYMDVKKDAGVIRADYMILIGETAFTDKALAGRIGENDYYIGLTAKETTLADGTKVPGAVLTILYGTGAEQAAMDAFKRIMPTSTAQIDFNMSVGFVDTNNQSLLAK